MIQSKANDWGMTSSIKLQIITDILSAKATAKYGSTISQSLNLYSKMRHAGMTSNIQHFPA